MLIVEMDALDKKLEAYKEGANGSLDLSGLDFGFEGAKTVGAFLPEQ
jgi:hypothetical protein